MVKHSWHIIGLLALCGCMSDDALYLADDAQGAGAPITFAADMEDEDASRGVVTTIDNLDVFAVSASVSDANGSSVYFANETYQFGRAGDQVHTSLSGQTYYWLDSDSQYDFFAYSPSTDMTFADGVIDQFDFVVSEDVAAQSDIVVCSVIDADYGMSVPLAFKHPLCKISLSQGAQMAGGTIQSVSFSGVIGKGAYDMRKDAWTTFAADTATYTYACAQATNPQASITGSQYNFFFIPQTLGAEAKMKVNFTDSLGVVHNYVKPLSGSWAAGRSYNYSLSISPQLDFIVADSVVDAYYNIVKVKVEAPDIRSGTEWAVSVAASDNAGVSVEWQDNVNSFARMGFWTDNYVVNGTATQSARGSATTATVSGAVSDYVYVFVPENIGSSDRTITVSAITANGVLGSTTITQKCPAWSGNTGWSQLDHTSLSDFGFSWNRSVAYVLPYSVSDYGLETDFSESQALSMLRSMISLGDASDFTRILTYYKYYIANIGDIWHYYLYLDYSRCNVLAGGSRTDGLSNTASLNDIGGTAATGAFEILVTRAAQGSAGGKSLFRLPSSAYSQENTVPRPSGIDNLSSSALCKVLKRNRFNYTVRQIGTAVLEYPSLSSSDLVWYLPAVGEFGDLPTEIVDPIIPSRCWSSTPIAGSTRAYLGNGVASSRSAMAQVRCCRSRAALGE